MMPIAKILLGLPVSLTSVPTVRIDEKGGLLPLTADTTLGKKLRKHGVNGSRVKSSTRLPNLVSTAFAAHFSSIRFRFHILLWYAFG
jgi:hypothetical protein